jgi:hypothetical protein
MLFKKIEQTKNGLIHEDDDDEKNAHLCLNYKLEL